MAKFRDRPCRRAVAFSAIASKQGLMPVFRRVAGDTIKRGLARTEMWSPIRTRRIRPDPPLQFNGGRFFRAVARFGVQFAKAEAN